MDRNYLRLREAGAIFYNSMFFRNPVLIGALGMYPIAAACFGIKNAVALSVLFAVICLPVSMLLSLFGMLLPRWSRPAVVLALSAVCFLPASMLVRVLLPGAIQELGMAGSLMICNSVVYSRADEYAPDHILLASAADALGCIAGFAATAVAVAAVREIWQKGGLWKITGVGIGSGLDLPFAGFLLLGFLAALVQWINLRRAEKSGEGR